MDSLTPNAEPHSCALELESVPDLVRQALPWPEARAATLETQCALQALRAAYEQAVSARFDATKAQQLCTELEDAMSGVVGMLPPPAKFGSEGTPRYLSERMMTELNNPQAGAALWLTFLPQLAEAGLVVPPNARVAFLLNYLRLLPRLHGLYTTLPLELLGQVQFQLPEYQVAGDRAALAEPSGGSSEERQWLGGDALARRAAVCSLLRRHDMELLLTWLTRDMGSLSVREQVELLELIYAHWLVQVSFGYQHNWWAKSAPVLAGLNQLLGVQLQAVGVASEVRAAAARLLRLVPHSSFEADWEALLPTVLKETGTKNKLSISLSDHIVAREIWIRFFPELSSVPLYQHAIPFLVSPQAWLKFGVLERISGKLKTLFTAIAAGFQDWTLLQEHSLRPAVLYFITRIKYELGEEALALFFSIFAQKLPAPVLLDLARLSSYDERESWPFLTDPENYPLRIKWVSEPYRVAVFNKAESFVTQSAAPWGPKFSRKMADVLVTTPVPADSCCQAVALALDDSVREQTVQEITVHLERESTEIKRLTAEIAAEVAPDRLEQARHERIKREFDQCQHECTRLNSLLAVLAHTFFLKQLVAKEVGH